MGVTAYCTHGDRPANNTVYQRLSQVRTFLRWCRSEGVCDNPVAERLAGRDSPLRSYQRTYGKVQAANPGRWLTRDQAFGALVEACQDGTLPGLRDELIVRLGLTGLRCSEIAGITVGAFSQTHQITWTGKKSKPRRAVAGTTLLAVLDRYLGLYPAHRPSSPLICGIPQGSFGPAGPDRLLWGTALHRSCVFRAVQKRAAMAGLGHVAPHDLRRSAAGILHRSVDASGAHHFDLLDIQRVLGHTDPATTMRSYLEPIDNEVLTRAAAVLD